MNWKLLTLSDFKQPRNLLISLANWDELPNHYNAFQSWDSELQTLPEQLFQQHSHMPNIAQYHKRNMVNVEEAVNDALRRTTKITEVSTQFLKL